MDFYSCTNTVLSFTDHNEKFIIKINKKLYENIKPEKRNGACKFDYDIQDYNPHIKQMKTNQPAGAGSEYQWAS